MLRPSGGCTSSDAKRVQRARVYIGPGLMYSCWALFVTASFYRLFYNYVVGLMLFFSVFLKGFALSWLNGLSFLKGEFSSMVCGTLGLQVAVQVTGCLFFRASGKMSTELYASSVSCWAVASPMQPQVKTTGWFAWLRRPQACVNCCRHITFLGVGPGQSQPGHFAGQARPTVGLVPYVASRLCSEACKGGLRIGTLPCHNR